MTFCDFSPGFDLTYLAPPPYPELILRLYVAGERKGNERGGGRNN